MLSLQRILEIRTYKTVWVMGHKIRKAMAARDADYKLSGLIELDDTYVGGPKPGKRGRGAAFLSPHQEDHPEPFSQGRPGLMKNRSGRQRGLVTTGFAGI